VAAVVAVAHASLHHVWGASMGQGAGNNGQREAGASPLSASMKPAGGGRSRAPFVAALLPAHTRLRRSAPASSMGPPAVCSTRPKTASMLSRRCLAALLGGSDFLPGLDNCAISGPQMY